MTHLEAIEQRIAREEERLRNATDPKEIALRTVWLEQVRKERIAELDFLHGKPAEFHGSDDDLLAALASL